MSRIHAFKAFAELGELRKTGSAIRTSCWCGAFFAFHPGPKENANIVDRGLETARSTHDIEDTFVTVSSHPHAFNGGQIRVDSVLLHIQ